MALRGKYRHSTGCKVSRLCCVCGYMCRCGLLCGSLWAFWGCGRVPVWLARFRGCMELVRRSVACPLCAALWGVLRDFHAWGVFLYPVPLFVALWAAVELWRHNARKAPAQAVPGQEKSRPGWAAVALFIHFQQFGKNHERKRKDTKQNHIFTPFIPL